jgi:hypothetical protein
MLSGCGNGTGVKMAFGDDIIASEGLWVGDGTSYA